MPQNQYFSSPRSLDFSLDYNTKTLKTSSSQKVFALFALSFCTQVSDLGPMTLCLFDRMKEKFNNFVMYYFSNVIQDLFSDNCLCFKWKLSFIYTFYNLVLNRHSLLIRHPEWVASPCYSSLFLFCKVDVLLWSWHHCVRKLKL